MLKTKNFIGIIFIFSCLFSFQTKAALDYDGEYNQTPGDIKDSESGGRNVSKVNVVNPKAVGLCLKGVGKFATQKGRGVISASDGLVKCNDISGGRLKQISTSENFKKFDWRSASIANYCKDECEEFKKGFPESGKISEILADPKNQEKTNQALKLSNCVSEALDEVLSCGAALHLIIAHGKSFDKDTDKEASNGSSTTNQPSVISAGQNGMTVSGNEAINCVSKGIETLDFKPCKEFNEYSNTLEVAHEAVKVGQNLYYQNKAIDTAYEASKNSPNDATAGLKAQKSSFKDMQENFTQNSAIEASKAAILLAKYNDLPSPESVIEKCTNFKNNYIDGSVLSGETVDPDERCKDVVANPGRGFAFLMNQQARDGMKKKMAMLGVKAVAEGANAYMASQRADQLSDAIANVESFKPVTAPGLEQAVDATFCQMNPGAAKCKTNLNSQFSTIGDNIVDFSNNGTGTVYSGSNDTTTNSNGSSPTTSGTTTAAKSGPIGSAITGVNNGSGLESTAAAATISKGNGPTGGGGGGGGGGSAGGGGGGGGAASGAAGAQQAVAGSSGKMPLYSGGGGGVSIMGGLGIKNGKKTADSSVNPFANLMGKDKASPDKVLNFGGRSPASVGTKGDNLFDMISKRYGTVNNDKRLLEYEEVK